MENIGIWIMVIIAWILFIISYLIPDVGWTLIIFLVLTVIAFSLIADWIISDTRPRRQEKSTRKQEPSSALWVSRRKSRRSGCTEVRFWNMYF